MGNAESQPVRNVDKRTARRDNSAQFNAAIWKYRANVLGPLQTMGLAQEALAAEAPAEVRSRLRAGGKATNASSRPACGPAFLLRQ